MRNSLAYITIDWMYHDCVFFALAFEAKNIQQTVFAGGHPPNYSPFVKQVLSGDRTGSRAFCLLWSYVKIFDPINKYNYQKKRSVPLRS